MKLEYSVPPQNFHRLDAIHSQTLLDIKVEGKLFKIYYERLLLLSPYAYKKISKGKIFSITSKFLSASLLISSFEQLQELFKSTTSLTINSENKVFFSAIATQLRNFDLQNACDKVRADSPQEFSLSLKILQQVDKATLEKDSISIMVNNTNYRVNVFFAICVSDFIHEKRLRSNNYIKEFFLSKGIQVEIFEKFIQAMHGRICILDDFKNHINDILAVASRLKIYDNGKYFGSVVKVDLSVDYICLHFQEIPFGDLSSIGFENLKRVFSSPKLCVDNEDQVFLSVKNLIADDPQNQALLSYVDPLLLSPEMLENYFQLISLDTIDENISKTLTDSLQRMLYLPSLSKCLEGQSLDTTTKKDFIDLESFVNNILSKGTINSPLSTPKPFDEQVDVIFQDFKAQRSAAVDIENNEKDRNCCLRRINTDLKSKLASLPTQIEQLRRQILNLNRGIDASLNVFQFDQNLLSQIQYLCESLVQKKREYDEYTDFLNELDKFRERNPIPNFYLPPDIDLIALNDDSD